MVVSVTSKRTRRQLLRLLGVVGGVSATAPLLAACGGAATTAALTGAATSAATPRPTLTSTVSLTSASSIRSASVATMATTTRDRSSSATAISAASSAPTSAGTKLTFLHWWTGSLGTDYTDYMTWAFDQYKARTGVTVTGIPAKPVTDTHQKFVTAVAGGEPPDAAFTSVVFGRDMYDQGLLATLDAYVAQAPDVQDNQFFAASKQFRQTAGHTFGLPVMGPESLCIGINQDIFQANGFDGRGKDVQTWSDLVRVGQKLTKTGAGGKVALAGIATNGALDLASFTAWVETTGRSLYDAEQNQAYFNTPEAESALQFLVDLANKDGVSAPLTEQGRPVGEAALAGGTAAMEFDETAMGSFPTIVRATSLKWWMIPYPKAPTGKSAATATWINFTVIPKVGKHIPEAFQFLRFFCGLDAAVKKVELLKADSPRLDLYQTPQWQAVVKGLAPQQMVPAIAKLPGVYPYHHNADQAKQITPLLQKAYTKQMDVRSALDEAQRLATPMFAATK